MGWSSSWLAFKGRSQADILQEFGLVVFAEDLQVGSRCAPYYCLEKSDGWTVLFSEDFNFATRERLIEQSHKGLVVSCQFEDKVEMTSVAGAAEDGSELWRVFHDNTQSTYRLDVTGNPPPELAEIHAAQVKLQDEEGDADYLHDVPLEIARVFCGYRADDEPLLFTGLKKAGEPWPPVRRSLFSSLFRALTGKGAG
jgi:hypothetical protein